MSETTDTWDQIADAWDESVGEGNDFQKLLIVPATEALLSPGAGMRVLDACCGNGNYARRLGRARCAVVAFDGSARMIELARGRTRPEHGSVTYAVADACDEAAVRGVGGGEMFDAAVCSMAMMDLPAIEPLLRAVRGMLKPGGAFVFSVGHPAFHTNEAAKWGLQEEGETPTQTFGCLVTRYLTEWAHSSRGVLGQPVPHTIWHRSISSLLSSCFAAGFVVDGMLEPAFPPDTRLRSPFSWARRPEIPPVLVVRLRPV